ncbi:unnamed protein product [Fraxinus pennsylvanica]|uniref:Uncharacterized protein n=1 Tax=Fraxinus pennsylvanica TaxID=56036 RepID=A0AAD2A4A2_9LAMI|nr:unnamed protein product [Fraxinus pennsylvanica]
MAVHKLKSISSRNATHVSITRIYISRTVHMQMIRPRYKFSNSPSYFYTHLKVNQHCSAHLLLVQRNSKVRRQWHCTPAQSWRPNCHLFVSLISRRERCGGGNLLAAVRGRYFKFIVVYADSAIRVAGGEGHLEIGSKEVGGGEAEAISGGALEDEIRLRRAEDEPYKEDGDEGSTYAAAYGHQELIELLLPIVVVAAIFPHVLVREQGQGKKNG